ncbi:MAG: hypothetical protein U1E65_04380 [Myxococcota bacterium]
MRATVASFLALALVFNMGCASVRTRSGDGYAEQEVFSTGGWFLLHTGAAAAVGGAIAVGGGASAHDGRSIGIGAAALGAGLALIGAAILWRSTPDSAFRGPAMGPNDRIKRSDDDQWMKEGDALARRTRTSSAAIEQE